jgi:plastocyanin
LRSDSEASVKAGDAIEWINKDVFAHTATARNGDFDVTMPPKNTVTSVVTKPGTVEYYCEHEGCTEHHALARHAAVAKTRVADDVPAR